jgi:hypothetical protein
MREVWAAQVGLAVVLRVELQQRVALEHLDKVMLAVHLLALQVVAAVEVRGL